jgi:23S rRNA (guanosine2251-2'-O)-methyltransferase
MQRNLVYLYGRNSVLERLKANPGSIKRIFLAQEARLPDILALARSKRIPVSRVSEKRLYRIKRAERIQGVVAEADSFSYTPLDELIDEKLTIVFLDRINDPHNLGSILRILACFGEFAVVIPQHSSCRVNDTVIHVASGGENFVPVASVANVAGAIVKAKKAGYWIAGTAVEGGKDINNVSLPFPLGLVLGSEGRGIRHGINKHLDLCISLPMKGAALSFNVAMACAIFCYEINRQRLSERKKK